MADSNPPPAIHMPNEHHTNRTILIAGGLIFIAIIAALGSIVYCIFGRKPLRWLREKWENFRHRQRNNHNGQALSATNTANVGITGNNNPEQPAQAGIELPIIRPPLVVTSDGGPTAGGERGRDSAGGVVWDDYHLIRLDEMSTGQFAGQGNPLQEEGQYGPGHVQGVASGQGVGAGPGTGAATGTGPARAYLEAGSGDHQHGATTEAETETGASTNPQRNNRHITIYEPPPRSSLRRQNTVSASTVWPGHGVGPGS